jgi:hypothetical protein
MCSTMLSPASSQSPKHRRGTVNRDLPAITTALGLLAVPVVGVACSSLALGEPLNFALLAAMSLIISGIAIGLIDPIYKRYRS